MQLGSIAYLPAGNSLRLSNLVASDCPVISIVWKEQEAGFPQTECYEAFPKRDHGEFLTPLYSDTPFQHSALPQGPESYTRQESANTYMTCSHVALHHEN